MVAGREVAAELEPAPEGAARAPGGGARALTLVRVGLGAALLALGLGVSVEAWGGVAYLAGLYGGLGAGLFPALLALWALIASVTLVPAAWAAWPLVARWRSRRLPRVLLLLALAAAGALVVHDRAAGRALETELGEGALAEPALVERLSRLARVASKLPKPPKPPKPLAAFAPVKCEQAPEAAPVTLVAGYLERRRRSPRLRCLQGPSLDAVLSTLRRTLRKEALRGPLELELISGTQRLSARHGWLDGFKLRPGLDGVCHERTCVLPWQLLFEGAFSSHRPLAFIPDLQFGVAPEALREKLAAPPARGLEGLTRITTRSFSLDLRASEPALTPLSRMRRRQVPLTDQTLERAERDAEAYVLGAQLPDGRFRYTLDPMSGQADTRGFNLARQAGTTLVLCELGRSGKRREAIARSLAAFEPFARTRGELSALTWDATNPLARLGESALPLVSMLACAADAPGSLHPLAAGLSRYLLRLQREDGSFAPALDLRDGSVQEGPEPLYAAGQAVMALVLLEQRQQVHPSAALPPYDQVHAAVERAMQYVAEEYWSHPLRDFFYLEENWHCLAARAALGVHRHPGYEAFCTDYVRFKARLILSSDDGVAADFDGGFGFGNLIPPHNTGAAGFGEALAASIAVLEARDQPTAEEKVLLGRVLGFLLRQQWSRENCFACATPLVVGGMSEHTHSAVTRIDFAQHAWAALGHGRRVLQRSLPAR